MNRTVRIASPALLLVVTALVALLAALAFGGGSAAPLLNDPGPVVRFGLPVAKLAVNLGAAGMIGALVLTLVGFTLVAALKGLPQFAGGSRQVWLRVALFNGAWGWGAALLLRPLRRFG